MADDMNESQKDATMNPSSSSDMSMEASSEDETAAPHKSTVHTVKFNQLPPSETASEAHPLDLIMDVQLDVTVELGRSKMKIRDILALGPGSVVELDKMAGEPADLRVNGKLLAHGEVVIIDESFGVRITEIVTPTERINSLS